MHTGLKVLIAGAAIALFVFAATSAEARTSTVPGLKSAADCTAEYKANKGALKDAKEKKGDFIKACRALPPGQATPIGTAAVAPAPTTAPAAPAPLAPSQQPVSTPAPSRPAPTRTAAATSGANQFTSEAAAKGRCPSATVVWVNTQSRIYHFAGTKNYGNTKAGAYMCETDATAAGDRASLREKHP